VVGITPGDYDITVAAAGHATDTQTAITTTAGTVTTHVVTLLRYPDLDVQVNGDDGSTVDGLTGATVTATPTAGGAAVTLTAVDASGSPGLYRTTQLSPTAYTISATKSGLTTATTTLTAVAGTALALRTVQVDALGSIELTAFDDVETVGVTELAGVDVDLTVPADPSIAVRRITTGADGVAAFDDLTPGLTYQAVLATSGHETQTVTVALTAGEAYADGVVLPINATLTVDVDSMPGSVALGGATVTATLSAGGPAIAVPETATGTYVLSSIEPGTYDIVATASGHTSATSAAVVITSGEDQVVNLDLSAQPELTITVRSAVTVNGATVYSALTNATVTATRETAGAGPFTFTHQGDGVYTATITASGTYDLSVTAPGHTPNTTSNQDVVVTLGAAAPSLTSVDLAAKTGSVAGTVNVLGATDDSAVTVTATRNGATVTATPDPTLAAGTYTLSGLAPGTWAVTFTRDTYSPLTISVTVPYGTASDTGASLTGVDATLAPLGAGFVGEVSGVASGLVPVSGTNPSTPLSGVTVALSGGTDSRADQTVVADGNGHYYFLFADLTPDSYTLTFSKAGYEDLVLSLTLGAAEIVVLTPTLTQSPQDVTFSALEGATAVQNVVFRLTNDDLLDSPGYLEDTTAADGSASIADVPPGVYTLTITPPAGTAVSGTPPSTVTVTTAPVSVSQQFEQSASVTGTVLLNDDSTAGSTGNDGYPNPGATVTITKAAFSTSTTTSTSDGTFTLTDVPQASGYTITVAADGYATTTLTGQTVGAGGLAVGNLTIDKLSSLTVSVVDGSAAVLSATTIGLFQSNGTTRINGYDGSATASGNGSTYTFDGLTPGTTVYVRATKSGYLQVVDVSTTLQAGANSGTEGLTVALPLTGTVTLTTTGLGASPDATQVTFSWTRLGTAETAVRTITNDNETPISVTGLPANTSIAVTHSDTTDTCSITSVDITTSPFTLTPGQTRALAYTCV
jgi:hypothetical protein